MRILKNFTKLSIALTFFTVGLILFLSQAPQDISTLAFFTIKGMSLLAIYLAYEINPVSLNKLMTTTGVIVCSFILLINLLIIYIINLSV